MIVADRKPFEEIIEMLKPYSSILLLGCNECVTVCAAGGAKEVAVLASEIRLFRAKEGKPVEIKEVTLERNCDPEYVEALKPFINDFDAVLSMACGCGIQFVGEHYRNKIVLPAVVHSFGLHVILLSALAAGKDYKDTKAGLDNLKRLADLDPIWTVDSQANARSLFQEEAAIGWIGRAEWVVLQHLDSRVTALGRMAFLVLKIGRTETMAWAVAIDLAEEHAGRAVPG